MASSFGSTTSTSLMKKRTKALFAGLLACSASTTLAVSDSATEVELDLPVTVALLLPSAKDQGSTPMLLDPATLQTTLEQVHSSVVKSVVEVIELLQSETILCTSRAKRWELSVIVLSSYAPSCLLYLLVECVCSYFGPIRPWPPIKCRFTMGWVGYPQACSIECNGL